MKEKLMKRTILKTIPILLLASLVYFTSCSKSGGSGGYNNGGNNNGNNPPPVANSVTMAGMTFGPGTLTVTKGTTVTFINNDNTTHTVTADDATFDSGNIAAGKSYTHTFNVAGTFDYHCQIHSPMKASITVTE